MSESTRQTIGWMDRGEIATILEGCGFAVYDDESTSALREALLANVEDGTIDPFLIG